MFTGIIETVGEIVERKEENGLLHLTIQSPLSHELKIDQSVSHNGMCLTVTEVHEDKHRVTLVPESLSCSHPSKWNLGTKINLERCLKADGRFDGHFVMGHVDGTLKIININPTSSKSIDIIFEIPPYAQKYIIHKGSICLDGISLTVAEIKKDEIRVSIIPYTREHTNLKFLKAGDYVHVEYDLIGKYIEKHMSKE
ncbi:MAG: riboflavin synthase [Bacteroidia bacterium]|nr:riboflavin synthase [Bacteroidia bacterium]